MTLAADLLIKDVKVDNDFMSWKDHSGYKAVIDLHKVEAVEQGMNADRPAFKCGSGVYYPPISYDEAVQVWSTATRNASRKMGF